MRNNKEKYEYYMRKIDNFSHIKINQLYEAKTVSIWKIEKP